VFPLLLARGLLLGPAYALLALPIGIFGFCLRGQPAEVPWPVRPLFALVATPVGLLSALITGIVPGVVAALGFLQGAALAVLVALGWRRFPEEPLR